MLASRARPTMWRWGRHTVVPSGDLRGQSQTGQAGAQYSTMMCMDGTLVPCERDKPHGHPNHLSWEVEGRFTVPGPLPRPPLPDPHSLSLQASSTVPYLSPTGPAPQNCTIPLVWSPAQVDGSTPDPGSTSGWVSGMCPPALGLSAPPLYRGGGDLHRARGRGDPSAATNSPLRGQLLAAFTACDLRGPFHSSPF